MLFRGVSQGHSHDDAVMFRKSHILVRQIMVGLGKRCCEYLCCAATEHETEESLGRLVNVVSESQPFADRGVGGPQDYWMVIHKIPLERTLLSPIAKPITARSSVVGAHGSTP